MAEWRFDAHGSRGRDAYDAATRARDVTSSRLRPHSRCLGSYVGEGEACEHCVGVFSTSRFLEILDHVMNPAGSHVNEVPASESKVTTRMVCGFSR